MAKESTAKGGSAARWLLGKGNIPEEKRPKIHEAQSEPRSLERGTLGDTQDQISAPHFPAVMAELAGLVQRLELAVGRLESMSGSGGSCGGSAGGVVSPYVEAFDVIVNGPVAQYLCLSEQIGGDVQKHAQMMKQAIACLRQMLVTASSSQKPSDVVMTTILQPLSKVIQQVQAFREANRKSTLFNHLSAVSESVPALGWVSMSPKPGPYVKEMQDAATFYTNRVLKDFKEKDKKHVDWVKAYLCIWTDLQNYIKQYHTTGLAWSKTGPAARASAAPPCAPAGGCPPPPPPPPAMEMQSSAGSKQSCDDNRNALFAAINKGADITHGLRHVKDDQKTHKNPNIRGQAAVVVEQKRSQATTPAAASTVAKKPVLELDGKKWKVENQEGAQGLVISDTELKQVVYAYKCNKSVLEVKGKINSITIDSCHKMGLVFQDVVGTVEVINSRDVKIQVKGKIPIISINKTDGCHVYLSKDSLSCEIISAKSSEMNILVPKDDGDFTEMAVPEQFQTVLQDGKLVTVATQIAG